ncbi:MAG: hypothetical protein OES26_25690 [Gammaproteobacteria bacterium]|nr:hypothetical protein [Gammaproteobacteria bacterium]
MIEELAARAELLASCGFTFRINAYVYFEGGHLVQVLGDDYEGGGGDWAELLEQLVTERLPSLEDAIMFRWQITPAALAGNTSLVGARKNDGIGTRRERVASTA